MTLPAAADNTGKVYVISKRDDGSNNLSTQTACDNQMVIQFL
jgi:hypothetical protein